MRLHENTGWQIFHACRTKIPEIVRHVALLPRENIFWKFSVLLRRYARPQLNFLFILFRVKGEGGKANIAINYDLFRYRAEEQIDWFSVMILIKEIKLWKIDEIV